MGMPEVIYGGRVQFIRTQSTPTYVRTLHLYVRRDHSNGVDVRIVSPEHVLIVRRNETVGDDAFQSQVTVIQRVCNNDNIYTSSTWYLRHTSRQTNGQTEKQTR